MLGLTVRGKNADKFWFSLFHELYHILSGHINNPEGTNDIDEQEADIFSKNMLIPQGRFDEFIRNECYSRECIIQFSSDVNITSGIVLGRLQKENYVPYNRYNDLKENYRYIN